MALIAIFAAMAVPRYANAVGRYRAECAARRIVADLALARAKAKAASSTQGVTFNAVAGTYTLSGLRDLDRPAAPYTVDLSAEPYHVKIAYADFGGVPQAQFDMYGNPLFDGKVTVRTGDYEQTVQVARADGTISLLKSDGSVMK